MSDFEFIFALFGLLLGLSLAEVLGGLARAIEAGLRPGSAIRIGWLTPLLGAFVMLDLLSFWQAAWTVRDVVGVSGKSLMAITLFASAYYLAAHLVFPRAIEGQPDFDAHFFRVRRIVIGVMFGLLLCQLAWYASLPALAPHLLRPLSLGLTAILALLMAAAMFVRGARWARLVMLALVARYILVYLL
ncbi:putative Abi (CAAX) family protease [Sphingomonas leidyi]|uniref:Putative Abi (CAAX) family protease n=1 Tax=Sphingomonas leidyi TaxID=68569 RepID=A0A7X5UY50_9SPHN|nr:hypothetical protein [Sphingomonas leidyi]NIJ64353.1 putative Abi (CAAX) family protease [Sphingomonas leidyi]